MNAEGADEFKIDQSETEASWAFFLKLMSCSQTHKYWVTVPGRGARAEAASRCRAGSSSRGAGLGSPE